MGHWHSLPAPARRSLPRAPIARISGRVLFARCCVRRAMPSLRCSTNTHWRSSHMVAPSVLPQGRVRLSGPGLLAAYLARPACQPRIRLSCRPPGRACGLALYRQQPCDPAGKRDEGYPAADLDDHMVSFLKSGRRACVAGNHHVNGAVRRANCTTTRANGPAHLACRTTPAPVETDSWLMS
jgi:hypothetical protein